MKGMQKKKLTVKIIVILMVMLFVDIFAPFYTVNANVFMSVVEWVAQETFDGISHFLVMLADVVLQSLQKMFLGIDYISIDDGDADRVFIIRYSPGIIFSGAVPAFDINFIKSEISITDKKNEIDIIASWDIDKIRANAIQQGYYRYFEADGNGYYQKTLADGTSGDNSIAQDFEEMLKGCGFENGEVAKKTGKIAIRETKENSIEKNYYVWSYQGDYYVYFQYKSKQTAADEDYYLYKMNLSPEIKEEIKIQSEQSEIVVIESSAKILQKTISTWYNVMKNIAIVGLLSVLVYVAIRMIISSSTEDKAKYKKMIIDWVTAICIIFLLHYFMAIILEVMEALCNIFNSKIIGNTGYDLLLSEIRTTIDTGYNFIEQFANIIIYLVLVILTVMFSFQYLKRFIYAAFLTMIAPLIALTYPLDKIKDGKAQAYTVWLREYIFTVLIQPVHLIIYYVLLGAVNVLIDAGNPTTYNPIYAIVAISFMLPAEKFIRKMFGFDKAEASNVLGSALGGAAIMSGIDKLGSKKSSSSKASGAGGEGNKKQVRTVNPEKEDPYKVLRGNKAISGGPGKSSSTSKRNIKNYPGRKAGFKNLAKKYVLNKNVGMGILRGTGKIAGAATLGTIGLAAGISTGEGKNVFAGAIGGIAAGKRVGGNLVDGGANIIKGTAGGINDIRDTYNEGKYGKEEYARMKFDKEFKKSSEYKRLTEKYQNQEDDIQEFLNAGITDTRNMDKAMQSINEGKYSVEEAIAYMQMAQAVDCPGEVLYDEERFAEYLKARGIPEEQAEEIRKGIVDFK